MATALDVITRAMRKAKILGVGKTPKAAEAEDALTELNDMISEMAIDGIDLGLLKLASTDTIDVPDDHISALTLILAARLAGIYGQELAPMDAASLIDRKNILIAYHFTLRDLLDDNPQSRRNLPTYD